MSVKDLVAVALGAALVSAFGFLPSIPVPLISVPITMQTLAVMLVGAVLGGRRGFLALSVFLLLLAAGLPLLPGGRGGIGVFWGPSTGYIIGWPFSAALIGFLYKTYRTYLTPVYEFLFLVFGGIVVVYVFGIAWLVMVWKIPLKTTLLGNFAFLPGDAVKVVLVYFVARRVRKALPGILH